MERQIGMYVDGDCLIVPIQTELRSKVIDRLQRDILEKVRTSRLRGVVVDLASVSLLDTFQAQKIFDIEKMVRLLGATTVFTGLSAGIVISLLDLGFEPGEIHTSSTLGEGAKLLQTLKASRVVETNEEDDAPEEDDIGQVAIDERGEDGQEPY